MTLLDVVIYAHQFLNSHSVLLSFASYVLLAALLLHILYHLALPKPIPGIPCNESSARKLLGDVPAMVSHMAQTGGTFTTYVTSTLRSLNAPLVQVFIRPFSKPLLILADFREAYDILACRSDFDRSSFTGALVKPLAPDHHVHLKTNSVWRAQRRLIQDLMTPSFLYNVAGPVIHQKADEVIELWRAKSRIAEGRPWEAGEDMNHLALDATLVFTYGQDFRYSAIKPALERIKALDAKVVETLRGKGEQDDPVGFPGGQVDEILQATLDLTAAVEEVQGSPLPSIKWAYVMQKPRIKRAKKTKECSIREELEDAFERLMRAKEEKVVVTSAVDHMILREKTLAERDRREPEYGSRVMIDEIFGFIVAGHDSSGTTISWGLKYLTDYPVAQNKLRASLQASFAVARSKGRNPTIREITSTHIPYLDATMEEILRRAGTVPIVDRQAVMDTELLGHRIPKGTVVSCLVTGPSIMSPSFDIDEARRSASSQTVKKEGRDRTWDADDMFLFKPERWLVRAEKGDGEDFDPAAGPQLAFGWGARQCYGKRLALLELRVLLTLIIWNFELLPCPPALSGQKSVLTLTTRPKDCYVRLREVKPGRE